MKLDKAIEIIEDKLNHIRPAHAQDLIDAQKLGIEAMKEVQKHRTWPLHLDIGFLPGETPSGNPLPRLAACLNETKNQRGTK